MQKKTLELKTDSQNMGKLFLNDTEMAKKADFRHYQTLKSSIRRELTEEDCSLTVIPGNSQGKNPFSISLLVIMTEWFLKYSVARRDPAVLPYVNKTQVYSALYMKIF